MKKKIKRAHILLLVLMGLCGALLGTGVALLILTLTMDEKALSLGGFICLILVAALCLALPLLIHYRDSLINVLMLDNALFGREVSFLDEDKFFKKHQKELPTVYALRVKLEHVDDLETKKVYFSLCDALEIHVSPAASIGYTRSGDFLFVAEHVQALLKGLENAEKKMLSDSNIAPFSLMIGFSNHGDDIQTRAKEALDATMINSSIRESMSKLEYKEENEDKTANFDIENEVKMQRFHFDVEEYAHEEEHIGLLVPSLYDASRGDILGKDLFRRAELYHVRAILDMHCFENAVQYLVRNLDKTLLLRIGMESIEDPEFLGKISAELQQNNVPANQLMLMIPALNLSEYYVRNFIAHARGLGIRIGVYEYGGEDVLSLCKIAPEVISFKTESTRLDASRNELDALLSVVSAVSSRAFIETGLLGEESSYYQKMVEQKEEEA